MNVSKALLKWYDLNRRDLPWRTTSDPYIIWLSEIILQQTRVGQGLPYFQKFISKYPIISDLARAPEDEVMKLWQGLGYYSRARNLHATAKRVNEIYGGIFPSDYELIRQLKGVGDYTAAAIASMAFGQPRAVVDGNVYRVLSRLFSEKTPVDSAAGKKLFAHIANGLLDQKKPGNFNQAMMELGAMICKPANPLCVSCPLNDQCIAYKDKTVLNFPVKEKVTRISPRYFNYLLVRHNKGIYMNKRQPGDIWEQLYELPLIETDSMMQPETVMRSPEWNSYFNKQQFHLKSVKNYPVYKLSHQHIYARLFELDITGKPGKLFISSFIKVEESEAGSYPVPRLIEKIFTDHL